MDHGHYTDNWILNFYGITFGIKFLAMEEINNQFHLYLSVVN
jgi:hypothetical protein